MAIARMLKVTVLGYQSVLDETVERLQKAGVLDVSEPRITDAAGPRHIDDADLRSAQESIADAEFVSAFLSRFHKPRGPFSAFISEKFHTTAEKFLSVEPDERFRALYRHCEYVSARLASIERDMERESSLVQDLLPWADLRLPIAEWKGTVEVALFTGTVPAAAAEAIRQTLREESQDITVEEVGPVGNKQAWVVMAHRDVVDGVRALLALSDFAEASFPDLAASPGEERALAEARLEGLLAERRDLKAQARTLADRHFEEVNVLLRSLRSRLDSIEVREKFGATGSAFVIEGWIPQDDSAKLASALAPLAKSVDVTLDAPAPDDDPPVRLCNWRVLRPFEVLTDLYGRPKYDEIDPTPSLAVFFWVFFGICIGDAGYGALLILGAYLVKTKLDVAPGVKKFMDLLMLGGVSTIIFGVLTASYFSIPSESLPALLRTAQVLNPIFGKDPQLVQFLIFTIALGVVQVVTGVLIAAYDNFRRGDWRSAVSVHLSTLMLFAFIVVSIVVPGAAGWALVVGLVLSVLLKGRVFEAFRAAPHPHPTDRGLAYVWLAGLAAIISTLLLGGPAWTIWPFLALTLVALFFSTTARKSVVATLGGMYEVYGLTGFVSDVLSYARLAALGLSSALIGFVINMLAGLLWGIRGNVAVSAVGLVLGLAVLLAGHLFNIIINLLGAFVHPARLQFVEFFSKFYEGGGRDYRPFSFDAERLVLQPTGVGRKGER